MNYLNFNPKWHKNEDISCLSELIEDEYLCQRKKRMNTISKKITAILLAFMCFGLFMGTQVFASEVDFNSSTNIPIDKKNSSDKANSILDTFYFEEEMLKTT